MSVDGFRNLIIHLQPMTCRLQYNPEQKYLVVKRVTLAVDKLKM